MKRRKLKGGVVHFWKVSGAGNNFVLLDERNDSIPMPRGAVARAFCVQGHSVGADGVLFIDTSARADFKLTYYNSDGGEAAMCGNGARCAVAYAFQKGIARASMTMETAWGIIQAKAKKAGVELNMGSARDFRQGVVVSTRAGRIEGCDVNTGVPHFVIAVRNLHTLEVNSLGREIRFNRIFRPEGVNVDFVKKSPDGLLSMRTYERGVEAETLACGTGAVAAAICFGTKRGVIIPIRVLTWGGETLQVRFLSRSNPLSPALLEGSAQVVYEGDILLSLLRSLARTAFKSLTGRR